MLFKIPIPFNYYKFISVISFTIVLFSCRKVSENNSFLDDNVYVTAPAHYIKKVVNYPQKALGDPISLNILDTNVYFITEYFYSIINNKYVKSKDIISYYPVINGKTDTTLDPVKIETKIRKYIQLSNGAVTLESMNHQIIENGEVIKNTTNSFEWYKSKFYYGAYDNADYLLLDSCIAEFPYERFDNEPSSYTYKTFFLRDSLNRLSKVQKLKFDKNTNMYVQNTDEDFDTLTVSYYYNNDNTLNSCIFSDGVSRNSFHYDDNTPSNARPFNAYELITTRYSYRSFDDINFIDLLHNYNPPLSNRLLIRYDHHFSVHPLDFREYYSDGNVKYALFRKWDTDVGVDNLKHFPLYKFIY